MPPASTLLFVYGTLMRGHSSHALLAGAACIGSARTLAQYTLLNLGDWPALWDGGTTAVAGELYAVPPSLLAALDAYEECPTAYRRGTVVLQQPAPARAQSYLLNVRANFPAIADGVWRGS